MKERGIQVISSLIGSSIRDNSLISIFYKITEYLSIYI